MRITASALYQVGKLAEAETALVEICKFCEKNNFTPSLQTMQDLAVVYWDMGNQLLAEEQEDKISNTVVTKITTYPSNVPPLALSKCVQSLGYQIDGAKFVTNFSLRKTVKLPTVFIEVTYEVGDADVPEPQSFEVAAKEFFVISPEIIPKNCKKWFQLHLSIYEDDTRQKKLGDHHQQLWAST